MRGCVDPTGGAAVFVPVFLLGISFVGEFLHDPKFAVMPVSCALPRIVHQSAAAKTKYQNKKRRTRRELLLEKMDALISSVKLKKATKILSQNARAGIHLPAINHALHALPAIVVLSQPPPRPKKRKSIVGVTAHVF